MTTENVIPPEQLASIPNPDAAGLIPIFDPPVGEEHPDERDGRS